MKTVTLFVAISVCLLIAGCGSTPEGPRTATSEPRNYVEAMDWIRDDIQRMNRQVTGGDFPRAQEDAEQIRELAMHLSAFDPARIEPTYEAYEEYELQAEDLHHTSDRLVYFIEQRNDDKAREQLIQLAARYNRLARNFGPAHQVSVLERSPTELERETAVSEGAPLD